VRRLDLSVVDTEEFLEGLRIRNLSRSDYENWKFSCPFPGHSNADETASAYMRDDNTAFFCHGCKRHGNAVTFLAEYEGVSFMEARRWIREQWGGVFREPEDGARAEWDRRFSEEEIAEAPRQTYLEESVLDRFDVDWIDAFCEWSQTGSSEGPLGYMFQRGFEPETLLDWQIGYDPGGERFTIPVRDEDGRLVGFKGRAWDPGRKPKYLALGDKPGRGTRFGFPTFEKSLVVFGLHAAHSERGRLIVVEGELNCIAMHQKGWRNVVAIAGSSLSDTQARLIRAHCDEAVIFFDTDAAGRAAAWGWRDDKGRYHPGAVDAFEPHMRTLVVPDHEGDPAEMEKAEIEARLADSYSSVSARMMEPQ
jgi:DNA primase